MITGANTSFELAANRRSSSKTNAVTEHRNTKYGFSQHGQDRRTGSSRDPRRCSRPLLLGESSRSKISRLLRLAPRVSRAAETSRRRAGPRAGACWPRPKPKPPPPPQSPPHVTQPRPPAPIRQKTPTPPCAVLCAKPKKQRAPPQQNVSKPLAAPKPPPSPKPPHAAKNARSPKPTHPRRDKPLAMPTQRCAAKHEAQPPRKLEETQTSPRADPRPDHRSLHHLLHSADSRSLATIAAARNRTGSAEQTAPPDASRANSDRERRESPHVAPPERRASDSQPPHPTSSPGLPSRRCIRSPPDLPRPRLRCHAGRVHFH